MDDLENNNTENTVNPPVQENNETEVKSNEPEQPQNEKTDAATTTPPVETEKLSRNVSLSEVVAAEDDKNPSPVKIVPLATKVC